MSLEIQRLIQGKHYSGSEKTLGDCQKAKERHRALFNAPHSHSPWSETSAKEYSDYFALVAERLALREPSPTSTRKFAEYDEKFARMDKMLALHTQEIAELRAQLVEEPTLDEPDEFLEWLSSDLAQEYAGRHVAFVPGVGVIAAADTPKELMILVKGHDLRAQAAIASVPDGAF